MLFSKLWETSNSQSYNVQRRFWIFFFSWRSFTKPISFIFWVRSTPEKWDITIPSFLPTEYWSTWLWMINGVSYLWQWAFVPFLPRKLTNLHSFSAYTKTSKPKAHRSLPEICLFFIFKKQQKGSQLVITLIRSILVGEMDIFTLWL